MPQSADTPNVTAREAMGALAGYHQGNHASDDHPLSPVFAYLRYAVSEERRNAGRAYPVAGCSGCEQGLDAVLLDADGTQCSISGRPGVLCHAVDDAWWLCTSYDTHMARAASRETEQREAQQDLRNALAELCDAIIDMNGAPYGSRAFHDGLATVIELARVALPEEPDTHEVQEAVKP